ncbi:MAG: radical SAM family heme chaperone HemW [Lachnospiraceae bacterium]|nr:radical SAM family heme chaperone HemW [Lachnospiraceae bacterium]
MNKVGLYIHIPFCVRKCNYCDFLSMPATDDIKKAYVEELIEEIKYKAMVFQELDFGGDSDISVDSVYIGGGTPSILPVGEIERIMKALRREFYVEDDAEVSMEVNPGTLGAGPDYSVNKQDISYRDEKVSGWRDAGINRLSIGLQSADNTELQALGRIHTFEEFEGNYRYLREAGFGNISVDLISSLPGQKLDSWEQTLKKVTELKPNHISAYGLIIEEGTPFYEKYHEDDEARAKGETPAFLPDEETENAMYELTGDFLAGRGYERYEISNYALPGYECRHNIRYWKRGNYLGFGIGAASLWNNKRYRNITGLDDYLGLFTKEEYMHYKNLYEETTDLDKKAQMEEFMFLGLRMMQGISVAEFDKAFDCAFEETYGHIFRDEDMKGLLEEYEAGRWRLTPRGVNVSNYVLAKMLISVD